MATNTNGHVPEPEAEPKPAIAPTQFIPQPPPQPFSGEDSTDAIALRAAISSLQFQKKKASDDIRTLEKTRRQALDDPTRFKEELAAGRVQEKKLIAGDVRAILDAESDEDDLEDEVMADATAGAERTDDMEDVKVPEIPDSQPSRPTTSDGKFESIPPITKKPAKPPFNTIPGPQNVVRMPHINWDKYHITGEPLDRMHEQQRRWPGSTAYGTDRGREFSVAAPYSPWQDSLDGQQDRKDSGGSFADGTGSEHPMETRRGGVRK